MSAATGFAEYLKLPLNEQAVVAICSIAYRRQPRSDLLACLSHADIKTPDGKKYNPALLKPVLLKLAGKKMLVVENQVACHPDIAERVLRHIYPTAFGKKLIRAVREVFPLERDRTRGYYWGLPLEVEHITRELRLAISEGNVEIYNNLMNLSVEWSVRSVPQIFLAEVCTNPFDPVWFAGLQPAFHDTAILQITLDAIRHSRSVEAYVQYLENLIAASRSLPVSDSLAQLYLVTGNLNAAKKVLQSAYGDADTETSKAMAALLQGNIEEALDLFRSALQMQRKASRKRNDFIYHHFGGFYLLALLEGAKPERLAELEKLLATNSKNLTHTTWQCRKIVQVAANCLQMIAPEIPRDLQIVSTEEDAIVVLFKCLVMHWFFPKQLSRELATLERYYRRANDAGQYWLALEFANILKLAGSRGANVREVAESLQNQLKIRPLTALIPQLSPWERSLNALQALSGSTGAANADRSEERLVYTVFFAKNKGKLYLHPKVQKLRANGNWTSGRAVALSRLANGELSCMTPQDHEIARAIFRETSYYNYDSLAFDRDKAVLAAVGHPLLFLEESQRQPVEILRDTPALVVTGSPQGFTLSLSAKPDPEGLSVVQESSTRFRVFPFSEEQERVAAILGTEELQIPADGEEKLRTILGSLSGVMMVHSTLEGGQNTGKIVDADSGLHGHLIPFGEGYRLDMLVKPVGEAGPFLKPGAGSPHILTTVNNQPLQARRNLPLEKQQLDQVLQACPTLQLHDDGSLSWQLDSVHDCLEVLLELREVPELITLEWPEGSKLTVQPRMGLADLAIRVEQQQDWFAVSGELRLDGKAVMKMHELLAMLESNPGSFVKISDGEYLALTETLRRRLEEIEAYSRRKGQKFEIHPAAAFSLADIVESAGSAKVDRNWTAHLGRMKSVDEQEFAVPSTLQAELRDYQITGFKWLARLAELQLGACLADDMGLGKTIQALALLLHRATKGPALVVAPASVTFNWVNEIHRFAPTLRAKQFFTSERGQLVGGLQAFDVLVCSYGLLQSEAERLNEVEWATIVLDEAQAIKNTATKRSKTAMQLRSGFKLITTGTPLENHLGELWNLFNFINPGLLGTLKTFNEKFAVPITKNSDKKAGARLKQFLQPFILRRSKSEVLHELPPKTEINLTVELSDEEAAFYEALRQKAVDNLANVNAQDTDGRFKVFAELMRLRRACCHSKLVLPDSEISSTKLQLFMELVRELLDNRHKVLVFSQFVGHLKIIAAEIEAHGLSYQYLDGSTPVAARKQRVEAFQAGEGDLFLISLRAGGTGLNLTAADYVIHMDPWWNPAVEDQASDRAHRIGQERPVTVYRMITKNTIEEKIIELHTRKRDLANTLLEGTDAPGQVSLSELLQLLRNM